MQNAPAITRPALLRAVLAIDAGVTGLTALAMAAAAGPLAALTALPEDLLRIVGLVLLPYVAWIAWLARKPGYRSSWLVVALNGVYALDCVLLLAGGWVMPNALGVVFVLVQAVAVAGFAVAGAIALAYRPHGAGRMA
jgi:uncharacterized protein YjeT (DUF2065 family)